VPNLRLTVVARSNYEAVEKNVSPTWVSTLISVRGKRLLKMASQGMKIISANHGEHIYKPFKGVI